MRGLAVAFAVLVIFAPLGASAQTIKSARVEADETHVTLHLEASGPIGPTALRSEAGRVRIWFHDLADDARLDPPVPAGTVRDIRIRPGFGTTMVAIFDIGFGVLLHERDIQVLSDGPRAFVRIPRRTLPSAASPSPPPSDAEGESSPGPSDVDEAEASSPLDALDEAKDGNAETAETEADSRNAGMASLGKSRSGSVPWMLIVLSMVLASVYGAIRWYAQRRRKNPLEDIKIVAQKRLGNRHQIVLVRALGQDHLLSVNGQQTQRIASGSSLLPEESLSDAALSDFGEAVPLEDPVYESRIRSALPDMEAPAETSSVSLRPLRLPKAPKPPRSPAEELEEKNRFGAELLRLALDTEERPAPTVRPPSTAPRGESEAVAGLLKLRDRLAAS